MTTLKKAWRQVFAMDARLTLFQRIASVAYILCGGHSQFRPRKLLGAPLVLYLIWTCYVLLVLLWPRKVEARRRTNPRIGGCLPAQRRDLAFCPPSD